MKLSKFAVWAIEQHANTNHFYDKYLPYDFHLRLVAQQVSEYKHLCDIDINLALDAAYGHDLIEDARVTWNNIVKESGNKKLADIIFAVTNFRGKTRAERAPDEYYIGIRKEEGATFIKLCDRLANLKYGVLTKSRMVGMYKEEHEHFKKMLYDPRFDLMFKEMEQIFENFQ